ncbi:hypothetical protein SPBRAN_1776 [uncultured Candidatus Thioglobus sp.]|nr:hypothetical protein SPBRAN_1776 [uncultured Candidatus Thioglobus sp.]
MNNHQKSTLNKKTFPQACATHAVHQLDNFLNPALALLGPGLRK